MGILKIAAKVVGTATLSATWFASGVLRKASDAAGFDIGSELFGMGQEASENGIKSMWHNNDNIDDDTDEKSAQISVNEKRMKQLRSAASQCFDMASAAQKVGNQEKYDQLIDRYDVLLEEIRMYEDLNDKIRRGEI